MRLVKKLFLSMFARLNAINVVTYVISQHDRNFGRSSHPNSHWLYQTSLAQAGSKSVIQYRDPMRPKENGMLVEIRIGGEPARKRYFPVRFTRRVSTLSGARAVSLRRSRTASWLPT
jgi:hypothetical protein